MAETTHSHHERGRAEEQFICIEAGIHMTLLEVGKERNAEDTEREYGLCLRNILDLSLLLEDRS